MLYLLASARFFTVLTCKLPLAEAKTQTELRKVKREKAELKKKLAALEAQKAELEQTVGK
jgi:hypothetical protein